MLNLPNIPLILIGLYLTVQCTFSQQLYTRGTMFPAPKFDPAEDCQIIHNSTLHYKSTAKQQERIVNIATTRGLAQRVEIRSTYKKLYKKDILRVMEMAFGNKYEKAMDTLFKSPAEIYAYEIHHAIIGWPLKNETLIEIMCCIDDASMEDIVAEYKKKYWGADIRAAVLKNGYGEYSQLLSALMTEKRRGLHPSESFEKGVVPIDDCPWISEAWGGIIKLFSKGSYSEIVEYSKRFQMYTGHTLEQYFEEHAPGNGYFEQLLLQILDYAKDPVNHYATMLRKFFQNPKLKVDKKYHYFPWLTRVLVLRSEIDLDDIVDRYTDLGEGYLEDDVRKTFHGAGFLELIYGNLIIGNGPNKRWRPTDPTTKRPRRTTTECHSRRCRPQ